LQRIAPGTQLMNIKPLNSGLFFLDLHQMNSGVEFLE